ncbi:MAG: hypothetical protein L6R42_003067 [Xanthoria sp. 1 TBL-2021]|nr:MAG: hypothetical protein L6R42_003067 [Xanthoria sp. 1 TBL-2021]
MHFSTISTAAVAALAFLATPAVGAAMPAADLAARSAELDARAEQLEARAALLVYQLGGVKACTAECIFKGHLHGGYCSSTQTCVCNHDD